MPWNPIQVFKSELTDSNGTPTETLQREETFTYESEKDPNDTRPFVFVMIDQASYDKDPPSTTDFILNLPCSSNPLGTKLWCTFEVPADLADPEVLLGFAPDPLQTMGNSSGYGGDKFSVT